MKLITPPLEIKDQDGFNNDALNRKDYGESLSNLITHSEDALVISLDARWGEGKTTFVQMWRGLLSQNKIPNIYIDAFTNDYVEDPFILVVSEIINYAEKYMVQNDKDELRKKAKKIGGLFSLLARIGVRNLTGGMIQNEDMDKAVKIIKDNAESLTGERIKAHAENVALISDFRNFLSELPSKLKENKDNKPLVIIIDELDRCKPTFAVEMVEKIKHLFSVENIIFLLAMNREQLEESIKSIYGNIDANTYLQKFINLETRLPKRKIDEKFEGSGDLVVYTQKLIELHELQSQNHDNQIADCAGLLANHLNLSLRQLEKVFTNLAVFYGSDSKEDLIIPTPIIVFVSVVKVFSPDIFGKLLRQEISDYGKELLYDEKLQLAKLEDAEQCDLNMSISWAFMSEDDFQALFSTRTSSDLRMTWLCKTFPSHRDFHASKRSQWIPACAEQLNMFTVSESQ